MRIIFMGSPIFAVKSLDALHRHYEVLSVYTQPPRPSGRGMQVRPTAVAEYAKINNITCYVPPSLKLENEITRLYQAKPDLIIVVAYGLILSKAVLNIPRFGCINGHASLLPRWRGAAPIQRAIEAGDKQSGVTTIQMQTGLDTGPMLHQISTKINHFDTFQTLHDRLAILTAESLIHTIQLIEKNNLNPIIQQETEVCYANKISKSEAELDLRQPAQLISNKIRAFSPIPGCWLRLRNGNRIKIRKAKIKQRGPEFPIGTAVILDGRKKFGIAISDKKVLFLDELQPDGKKLMNGADFLNGYTIESGEIIWEYGNS
ncbi:methionyl-tRNA formyltransferase [Alphaproteobacteria bacterium]|nr:methionyl-tRNA formyltransferase [Alphaproteobacteria bacterium]